jgi:uncharacterized protein (UPF0297 family)
LLKLSWSIGGIMDKTTLFDITLFKQAQLEYTIKEVYRSLLEKGYDPVNQLVGYLTTGDANYISNYNQARSKILEVDRELIIAFLLEHYLK